MRVDRVDELEVKVAFVEARLLDLDDVVRELADQLAALRHEVESLRERVEAEDLTGTAPEKPPHY